MKFSDCLARYPDSDKLYWHSYGIVYDILLSRWARTEVDFLEIGVWSGGSTKAFEEFFSASSRILAMDVDLSHLKHEFPPGRPRAAPSDGLTECLRTRVPRGPPGLVGQNDLSRRRAGREKSMCQLANIVIPCVGAKRGNVVHLRTRLRSTPPHPAAARTGPRAASR